MNLIIGTFSKSQFLLCYQVFKLVSVKSEKQPLIPDELSRLMLFCEDSEQTAFPSEFLQTCTFSCKISSETRRC